VDAIEEEFCNGRTNGGHVIHLKDGETMAASGGDFGISRRTGYEILERYE
jgi:hypothetical protein